MWVLIDNYDSFTHILHHYLLQAGGECLVVRNDALSVEELADLNPTRLILSPGPETPVQAGITMDAIAHFHDQIPILGICLGHQALGMFFGAELKVLDYPMHGKTSSITHSKSPLFTGTPAQFKVMRYHSLYLEGLENTGLQSQAYTQDDKVLMAMQHQQYPCTGIQFHPESILTEHGLQLIKNWAKS